MTARTVTGRQFAKLHGVSHTTVQGWLASGAVVADAKGRIPLAAGNVAVRKLRAKAKDEDPRAQRDRDHKSALLAAEVVERQAKAEARVMENRQRAGELLEVVEVRADAAHTAELVRTALRNLPPGIAPALDGIPEGPRRIAEIDAALAKAIDEALEALQRSRFAGGTTP